MAKVFKVFLYGLGILLIPVVLLKVHIWNAERQWPQRLAQLQATRQAAQPLIRAIQAYSKASGHPPGSLSDLVPKYIKAIPAPGAASVKPTWHYTVDKKWKRFVPPPRNDHYAHTSDWALGIDVGADFCPFHRIMSFGDYFMYHPRQDYSSGYGGGPEPLWDWAYYHE